MKMEWKKLNEFKIKDVLTLGIQIHKIIDLVNQLLI